MRRLVLIEEVQTQVLPIDTWIDGPGSTTCGDTVDLDAYVYVSCGSACINGLIFTLSFWGQRKAIVEGMCFPKQRDRSGRVPQLTVRHHFQVVRE